MKTLFETIITFLIIIIMLKAMNLLSNDKKKIVILALIAITGNYVLLTNFVAISGINIIYYLINILIIACLCHKLKEGLFYAISYFTIYAIVSSIILYINIYLSAQLYQIMAMITNLICACLLFGAKRMNLINYYGNRTILYVANGIYLVIAMYFNHHMLSNYEQMPNIYYWGIIILAIWLILNKGIDDKIEKY